MTRLFERNNINTLPFIGDDGTHKTIIYTNTLLAFNVFFEYYIIENETASDFTEETVVSAITLSNAQCYSYDLFKDDEFTSPLVLYRVIADAITFIEKTSQKELLNDLKEICYSHFTSSMFLDEQEKKQYNDIRKKDFDTVMGIIKNRTNGKDTK